MGVQADWAPYQNDIAELLTRAGFASLARRTAVGDVMDYELEAALRVVLLQRRIPYIPLSMSGQSEPEQYLDSFGIDHAEALAYPAIAKFQASLPVDVVMFHVHPDSAGEETEFGPGWVVVVQADRYGFILEEHFTLTRLD